MSVIESALLDELLERHAPVLGRDHRAYRNHCQRVVNFCAALAPRDEAGPQKMAIAAAFHDLGIWTHGTFDYLPPSEELAAAYLADAGKSAWTDEVVAMVREHHRIRRYSGGTLVEAFRKADWLDVTQGLLSFGLPRTFRREVFAAYPNAGFHKRLLQLGGKRLLTHPWNPMPMMRW